ncbi:SDR family oxidoreductase [Butyrivibrio sp. AE2032]|uniref:SDR family oxidoreductase n=1 Tax=Butyrivibrio sp. AE2032 TaxID=1458463 RepID=UPI00068D0D7B|nr:sugar nucleotide-binding protein [Butyrivibrio sp. AE2032]
MILVTGATGFVGKKIMEMCEGTVAAPSLRNASEDQVRRIVEESGADTIIHSAAISDIRTCEADPEASYIANVQLPVFLARAAKGRKLVCFSSDQVYTGVEDDGPYTEEDANPANTYARHKMEMEQRVLDITPDAVMLRAEWMYDFDTTRSNYYTNMLSAQGIVRFSKKNYRGLTYVKEVAQNMDKVITLPGGAYNFGSETTKSMYEVTSEFAKALSLDLTIEEIPPLHNLWMNCSKARQFGVTFSEVSKGLLSCARDSGRLL